MFKFLNCACAQNCSSFGYVILRVVTGIVFLAHGWQKFSGGVDQFSGFLGTMGIPAAGIVGWIVVLVEIVGGSALILGLFTHWAAKLLIIDMLGAIFLVHLKNGFFVGQGGYEFVLLLLVSSIAIMTIGSGKWSLDSRFFKKRS